MRPFCVGLTGGVGAGKSAVASLFADLGIAVVDTDRISHELTAAGGAALPAIVSAFGPGCIGEDGALARHVMRERVFSDPDARRRLEAILHPLIRAEAAQGVLRANTPYVLLVVPLLAEHLADYRGLVDRIAVVDCDESQQLDRIMARPGMDKGQAEAMLAAQSSCVARLAIADDVIDNRGDRHVLAARVAFLHGQYLAYAARGKAP